ncbi:hypothetical protein WJX72_009024 [[Myrmecia] bisecta]|uniref:Uncharacterized protein n=1 Tax=[Myrmecia] bisecta TaxID=41462 RepID=A0AAW1PQI0_9CHLO
MTEEVQLSQLYRISPAWQDFYAGGLGGVAGILTGQPLDTIRIRIQQRNSQPGTIWSYCRATVQREGLTSLFKGAAYPVTTIAVQSAVVFQTYGLSCRYLANRSGTPADQPVSLSKVYLAGMVAGTVQTAIITPVDLLKIRMQVQHAVPGSSNYVGSLKQLRNVLAMEGVTGLYRGLGVTLIRDIPSHGVYFGIYEWTREYLEPGSRMRGSENPWALFAAGGLAGVLSWFSVYPLDVIKSRLQADPRSESPYRGWIHCAKESYREEGGVVFWRGLTATLSRAFIVNAALFAVYEYSLNMMRRA